MTLRTNHLAVLLLSSAVVFAGAAEAQTLPRPSPCNAPRPRREVNQTLQQTQQNNAADLQSQLQQNEAAPAAAISTMAPPGFQQPAGLEAPQDADPRSRLVITPACSSAPPPNEAGKQRMRLQRPRFQFRMELHPNEPGMVSNLHDFRQPAVRRPA